MIELQSVERPWPRVVDPRPAAPEMRRVSEPSVFEWVVAVFAVIIQMGAFVSLDLVVGGGSLRGDVRDPLNTVCIALSAATVGVLSVARMRQLGSLALRNGFSVLFALLVLLSALWSIHPDVTLRRGAGYLLTMLIAGFLCVRFDADDRVRVLSWGFALSAIASALFVAFFPQYGIMRGPDLGGDWRGVFPHKNVLGSVMAVAVFCELYLLVRCNGRPRFRWALLSVYLVLVTLSHSATAWLLTLLYLGGTGLYVLWKRDRLMAAVVTLSGILALLAVAVGMWDDPSAPLRLLGKDMTLTGRTTLWEVVLAFIRERPLLGWGYHAMWQLHDPTTTFADKLTGGWGVTGSHNAFLEITLELGLVGVGLMLIVLGVAFWRALRACGVGLLPLGWFCLIYMVGAILSAQVGETLGQNQVIEWVAFNVLSFSCGFELVSHQWRRRARLIVAEATHAVASS